MIKETSSVFASSVTYLIPIVAIIWGIIDGEGFSIFEAIFCFVIFAGVYLIRQSPQKNLTFFLILNLVAPITTKLVTIDINV